MSTNFKPGDKIKMLEDCCSANKGGIYTIQQNMSVGTNQGDNCSCTNKWELINNKSIMSNLKEKFVQIFLSEPEKSFRKAGITNGDGILTSEGQEVFLTWVLKKYGSEFKTDVVDKLLEEEKE